MKAVLPSFIRSIWIRLLTGLLLCPYAASVTPSGQAMEDLLGVDYTLYARQPQTQAHQALNCITAVIYALRQQGWVCPNLNFQQGRAYWWHQAQPLQLGQTPFPSAGAMLLSRAHFLLLHTDSNANGRIDADDLVIHANYRPVQINRIGDWIAESKPLEIRYIPLDAQFHCPGTTANP